MNDKLHEAMQEISEKHLLEAAHYKKRSYPRWLSAAAAILVLMLGISSIAGGLFRQEPMPTVVGTKPAELPVLSSLQSPHTLQLTNMVASPVYPEQVQKPSQQDYMDNMAAYDVAYYAWVVDQKAQYDQPLNYAGNLQNFFAESIRTFLSGEENGAYSPINVYMALALLAESADGNSRQQILDLLNAESIDQLRRQANNVWNAHYCNDGETTLVLGNAIWLSDEFRFNRDTVQLLADNYFTSSFSGKMGSDQFTEQLRQWLNSQTGGLLENSIQNLELTEETAFALTSTIYYSAGWEHEFFEAKTEEDIFHCSDKDLITTFMNKSYRGNVYYGDHFTAVQVGMKGENDMWLFLPDEKSTVQEILNSDEYMQLLQDPNGWEQLLEDVLIHLKVPKFDVDSSLDLTEGLHKLGVSDIFSRTNADFSPLIDEELLYVDSISHAARVRIDEEGCTGAAYTITYVYASDAFTPTEKPEEFYFTADRPFLFVISSRDQLPLFAGVVAQP